MKILFVLFLITFNLLSSEAIFTHLTRGEEFCAYKTLTDSTNFTGSYVISGYNEDAISMTVIIPTHL